VNEQRSYDAIIVGGGIIGLAIAWRLARRGAEVVVLDRASPPAGATRVAAGMLAPVGELTFGEPELLELTLAAAELYPDFGAELERESGVATGYTVGGALHVALDGDESEQLRRIHDLQRSLGLEAAWLAPSACRELEPALSPSLRGGVHAAGEGAIDPRALAAALLAALDGLGAALRTGGDGEVVGALTREGRIEGVRTAAGAELLGERVVLATGAWAGRAEWLPPAARPAVRPVKGQILELRPTGAAQGPISGIVASEHVYLVPRPDGRLIAGATVEEQGFDTTVTAGGVHELLREAYRLVPEVAEMELVEAMAALRPGTPDNLPIVAPSEALDGLLVAAGHFRNGILLAPLAAERLASLLSGPSPTPDAFCNPEGDKRHPLGEGVVG
jgi:glycine oxidase